MHRTTARRPSRRRDVRETSVDGDEGEISRKRKFLDTDGNSARKLAQVDIGMASFKRRILNAYLELFPPHRPFVRGQDFPGRFPEMPKFRFLAIRYCVRIFAPPFQRYKISPPEADPKKMHIIHYPFYRLRNTIGPLKANPVENPPTLVAFDSGEHSDGGGHYHPTPNAGALNMRSRRRFGAGARRKQKGHKEITICFSLCAEICILCRIYEISPFLYFFTFFGAAGRIARRIWFPTLRRAPPTPNAETLISRRRRRWGAEELAQKARAEIPKFPADGRDSAILTFRGVPWRRRGNSAWGGAH